MAGDYVGTHPGAVAAYVTIGMSGGTAEARLDNVQTVGRIQVPTLDLYGQNDLDAVVGTERPGSRRRWRGKLGPQPGPGPRGGPFFEGRTGPCLDTMTQWLDQTLIRP